MQGGKSVRRGMTGQHTAHGPQTTWTGSPQLHTAGSVGDRESHDVRLQQVPPPDMTSQQATRRAELPQRDSSLNQAAFPAGNRDPSTPNPRTSAYPTGYSGQEQTTTAIGSPRRLLPMTQTAIANLTSRSPLKDIMSPPSLPFVCNDEFRLAIAINTVISLAPKRGAFPLLSENMDRYMSELVQGYNNEVPIQHPRMTMGLPSNHGEWSIKICFSTSLPSSFFPCLIELSSPFFSIVEDPSSASPSWQTHIEALWTFLNRHYVVKGDADFNTGIVVRGMNRTFTVPYIKRISQAIVHFEPFIMGTIVNRIRSARPVKGNWRDNPRLGVANLGRPRSIAAIEATMPNSVVGDPAAVLDLIQAPTSDGYPYSWSFVRTGSDLLIQYHKPQGCATAGDAITWMEFIVSFIQGSLAYPSTEVLQEVPLTRKGLRYFMYGKESRLGRYRFGVYHNPNVWSGHQLEEQTTVSSELQR
ncbi:hypothetical protein GJ744_009666 [Endocarpon pusillum]|uniref:Uncharacterized protein n=1 Tax=Endocarpon pusillum TaxID=364733 RepID=A0A8H7AIL8_9EURO|nr:hypothetical protein GJ744_009666 [Endocarpon pusillum]